MNLATIATTVVVVGNTARLALNVSNGLLIHSKTLDEAVRNLQTEVKIFGDACAALQSLLHDFLRSQPRLIEAQDEQLFARLQRSMSEYGSTIEPIDQCIRRVDQTKTSLLGRNRLKFKKEDIVRVRQRIEAHLLSVQLTLGILNLRASLLLVDNVELAALRASISEVQRKRNKLQATSQVNSPYLGQDQKLYQSTAALIADADLTLNGANSVYEDGVNRCTVGSRSLRGSRTSSTIQSPPQCLSKQSEVDSLLAASAKTSRVVNKEAADWQESVGNQSGTSNLPNGRIESQVFQNSANSQSFLSINSLPQPPQSNINPSLSRYGLENKPMVITSQEAIATSGASVDSVNQWIDGLRDPKTRRSATVPNKPPVSLESDLSSTIPSESLPSRSAREQLTSSHTSWTFPSMSISSNTLGGLLESDAGQNIKSELAVIDDSDEDDIGVELAKNVIATGKSALEKESYEKARGYLLEGLSLVQQLPLKLQVLACDMLELRYGLAMCSLSLDSQVEQEKALLEVLQQDPSSDSQREKLFHVSHILAQLYITTARLDLARQSCNNALRGRRKLLGKQHNDYFASLALVARICELQNAPIQAQGYMDMIPETERQKYDFHHLRMESHCEKEAVGDAVVASPSPSCGLTARESTTQYTTVHAGFTETAEYDSPFGPSSRTIACQGSITEATHPTLTAEPIPRKADAGTTSPVSAKTMMSHPALRHADLVEMSESNRASGITHATSSVHNPPPIRRAQNYADVPLPNPGNNYLGFCKGACQLQNGDRKAMKKVKEHNHVSDTVYWLRCSAPKCDFATEINLSLIWTWKKVWRLKESHGIAYRWSFLVKSHVRQAKMKPHQAMYKCLFCVFLGVHAPVIQGTDLYFDHIAQKHRGTEISQVVLHKTNCVTDYVCRDEEDFDINLYPLNSARQEEVQEESEVEYKLDHFYNTGTLPPD